MCAAAIFRHATPATRPRCRRSTARAVFAAAPARATPLERLRESLRTNIVVPDSAGFPLDELGEVKAEESDGGGEEEEGGLPGLGVLGLA